MSPEIDLRDRLDHELGDLPDLPAGHYLQQGRRVRRRRRVLAAGAVAAISIGAAQLLAPGSADRTDSIAVEPTPAPPTPAVEPTPAPPTPAVDLAADPDFVAPAPSNPVEAQEGLDGVDWFTTDDIPQWAQEYGNHGPISVSPEGRLWIAPEATIRRIVVDPYPPGEHGIVSSWAVEAHCTCFPEDMTDDIGWVIVSSGANGQSQGGTMEVPGWVTDDFELWVDGATAQVQERPTIGERFAHFADRRTGRMVAGAPGVTLVQQVPDADLGSGRVTHTRAGAAEVEYDGQTFYVVGVDPDEGAPWYQWWTGDTQPDFDAFLTFLRGNW
ncbi:hypothetical protein SAMN04489844_1428 [Nocardioides exalbidus]|uniref:Uncharacterized protein n=1 Tax=Nocardioides exalbidus TaxID=402596 RepID=A0A1H4NPU1_9ACTN|nr:hypothetical protein [Nocardioides exalbidus]SEB97251.1 hypothetical protein SAMN04489844_1428 [Nocardioides exalbidus]